jgi:3-oxoadipate enol-lactonase
MSLVWIDRMAVDVRGEGDAVVFIHGLGGSLDVWTPLLPALSRFRCVRLELPGAAHSSKAYALGESTPHRGKISVATHADAVRRVCESLGITKAHLVGHSFGTIVAQHIAASSPQLVRSLALFGALAEPPAGMRDTMVSRAQVAREQGMFGIAEGTADFALSASTKQTQPVTVAFVRNCVGAQDVEGYARNCEALAEARSARLELIRCPVLIVNGDEDQVTVLSGARQLADKLSHAGTAARVEVFARCGHWPMLERASESQRALRDFLQSVR